MLETADIEALPRQKVALACPAFELMYGGQKGGGKSFFLCLCWAALLDRSRQRKGETGRDQRHCRIPIFRRNLNDLADVINKSHEVFPLIDPSAHFNTNQKIWHFWSGATVEFHHLDGPEDHKGWNGQEIMGLGIDQVEEIPEHVYTFLFVQVRTKDDHYRDLLRIRSTANPGGRYGDWVKRRFVDPHPPGNKIIVVEVENRDGAKKQVTRAFIPAALQDNKYLAADGSYEANLRASGLPDHLLKAYLDGDWNVVKGAFFASMIRPERLFFDFRKQFPRGIPTSWEMRGGLDWGATAPAAGVFGVKDNDDRLWIVGEHVKPGITGRRYGESLMRWFKAQRWSDERKLSHEEPYLLIDHQAMGQYGSEGATAADGIRSWGWRIFPANKDRYSGIEQICERLQTRADGFPSVRIALDMCPNLAAGIAAIDINPKDQKDYNADSPHAHVMDAFRFLLMDWPVLDLRPEDPRDKQARQWEDYIAKARARQHPQDDTYSYAGYG